MRFLLLVSLLFLLAAPYAIAQQKASPPEFSHPDLWSFETLDRSRWDVTAGQELSLSDRHYKHGSHSLAWRWEQPGTITLRHPIGFKPFVPGGDDTSISSFVIWIYNSHPVNDHLEFVFGTGPTDNCRFPFLLDFKGWRAAWVSFERDMEGQPVESMNRLRIESPKSVKSGTVFIDHMVLSIPIDSRHHTPDHQVPFVNRETVNHWLVLERYSHYRPDLPLPGEITSEHNVAFRVIEQRFREDITRPQKITSSKIESLRKKVSAYNIKRQNGGVTGQPLWFSRHAELYVPWAGKDIASFFKKHPARLSTFFSLMADIAQAHNAAGGMAQKEALSQLFLDMYHHVTDQGVDYGSSLGTIHHYGYNWRDYYRALYLMKEVLKDAGVFKQALQSMQWYSITGELFEPPHSAGMDMDAFNTQVMGRLASILMMDDSAQKVQYLHYFVRWIDNGLLPAPGLKDAFKIDGSAYHHANHYPAYAIGGMKGAVRMVYFLSRTPFRVSQQAHQTLKKALMTMQFYCNLRQWPVSMSGRHPDGTGSLVPEHFAILALAGNPGGTAEVDHELARAFLRLDPEKSSPPFHARFAALGLEAATAPQGYIVMPYAASAVFRRDNWAVSVRGHSRYLWAAEHYYKANLYGRYMAHGTFQIMGSGNPVTNRASGYVHEGWDWNRFPGTTVINLPVDSLEADIRNVDRFSGFEEMLFSDQAFCGGVQESDSNGIFAFILHEHDKYQGSLRARKSWFFFGERIICLGSGIENDNDNRPTETTLFQNYVAPGDPPMVLNGEQLPTGEFGKNYRSGTRWLTDNKNNGYLVQNASLKLRSGMQVSRHQKTGEQTRGTFSRAMIDHGKAPKDQSYHYCVWPQVSRELMEERVEHPGYRVLEATKSSHVLLDSVTGYTGYVFFDAHGNNAHGVIQSTNIPCMALSKKEGNLLQLHVANPDLALYSGPADEIYMDGRRVERSIYSRPWKYNESQPVEVVLTVKGVWKLQQEAPGISVEPANNHSTLVRVICRDGLTQKILLER